MPNIRYLIEQNDCQIYNKTKWLSNLPYNRSKYLSNFDITKQNDCQIYDVQCLVEQNECHIFAI